MNSTQELEEKLNSQGRTIYGEKEMFMKQQTAVQFMAVKAKANNDFSREEVLARYKSNIKDYEYPSKVRWQRIRITFSKHGGKEKSIGLLDEVIHKLQAGDDFGALAKNIPMDRGLKRTVNGDGHVMAVWRNRKSKSHYLSFRSGKSARF